MKKNFWIWILFLVGIWNFLWPFASGECHAFTVPYDSHRDDPVKGELDKDDFDTVEEWEHYLENHPTPSKRRSTPVSPKLTIDIEADLAYTITGLPSGRALQAFYITSEYIYVTQRNDATTYLSRCSLDPETKIATYMDRMILKNFGHGQTLECYEYNQKSYILISCKANTAYDNDWAMQFGRMEYDPGKTLDDYTGISRFSDLNFANYNCVSSGNVKRIDAALSNDQSKILLWIQNTENAITYSVYDANRLNQILDATEQTEEKYISFENNTDLQSACLTSFEQATTEEKTLPNNSHQGIEISDEMDIYIVGGKTGETPKMSVMKQYDSFYEFDYLATFLNAEFDNKTEIEGIQLGTDSIYFGICDHTQKKEQQFIYSFDRDIVEANVSSHYWYRKTVVKEATCSEPGDQTSRCFHCGAIRHEEIPVTEHPWKTEPTVVTEPTCTKAGLKVIECSICGAVREGSEQEIAPVGHSNFKKDNSILATCAGTGYTGDLVCGVCGTITEKGETIAALGHQWTAGKIVKKPTAIAAGIQVYQCSICKQTKNESIKALGLPKKGAIIKVGTVSYQVTKSAKTGGTVTYRKTSSKASSISIPSTVKISGVTYQVTAIGPNAFKSNQRIKKVIIGSYVKTIHKNAFYGCKKLKSITIKTTRLTSKTVAGKAFAKIDSRAKIKVPKKKLKDYKKLLKKKGIGSKVKIYS